MNTKNLPLTDFEVKYLLQVLKTYSQDRYEKYLKTPQDSFKKPWLKDEYLNTNKIIAKLKAIKV